MSSFTYVTGKEDLFGLCMQALCDPLNANLYRTGHADRYQGAVDLGHDNVLVSIVNGWCLFLQDIRMEHDLIYRRFDFCGCKECLQ